MSAAEIIAEIQKLPPAEREQVLDFLQQARGPQPENEAQVRHASDAAFEKAADKVLNEHAGLFRRLAR